MGWDATYLARALEWCAADAGSIPQCGKDFFLPESTFSADSLTVSVHPHAQSLAFTSVCMLKILWFMSEFGGLLKHKNTQHAP